MSLTDLNNDLRDRRSPPGGHRKTRRMCEFGVGDYILRVWVAPTNLLESIIITTCQPMLFQVKVKVKTRNMKNESDSWGTDTPYSMSTRRR